MIDLSQYKIIIENPKGTKKVLVADGEVSDYPLKKVMYPVDYGSIAGFQGEDGDDLDVFVGSGHKSGFLIVRRPDIPTETKIYFNLTEIELDQVKSAFQPVMLECKELLDVDLANKIESFRKS